jgi:MATE family multidrug resistance protein
VASAKIPSLFWVQHKKEIKAKCYGRLPTFPSANANVFEVGLFTGAIWLSGLLEYYSQAANQIALSLASLTFMFAMGFECSSNDKSEQSKRPNGFMKLQVVAQSIFLLLGNTSGDCFALIFVFYQYLPQVC